MSELNEMGRDPPEEFRGVFASGSKALSAIQPDFRRFVVSVDTRR